MSYRFEKNQNGEADLVIEGFENGIADSPISGIANMRNVNFTNYPGVVNVNYKRLAATISGGSMKKPQFYCTSPAGINYILDSNGQVWKQSAVNSSTFNLLTGNTAGGNGQGIAFWNNYLFVFGSNFIDICGDGTGDGGIISSKWNNSATPSGTTVWPLKAPSSVLLTGSLSAGATSATLSSYTDGNSSAQTSWVYPSGSYLMTLSTGQKVSATLTYASTAVSFSPAVASGGASSSVTITPLFTNTYIGANGSTSSDHMTLVSGNDGNLYFCNGRYIGSFSVPSGSTFNLGIPATYNYSYAALTLPQYETAVWLEELVANLIIAGVKKLYPWNRVATSWQNPVPITEPISKFINYLNTLYIFAGQKGNIYVSNGYSVSQLRKIPDYVTSLGGTGGTGTSLVDPLWTWGGIMVHRNKIYFQALGQNSSSATNIISGVFSLDVNTKAINFENQNSFGLISNTTSAPGILIDNTPSSTGFDSYYSGWSNGNSSAGGIDYNDTTLYSSNEAFIESDLIPIGTALQPKTYASAEFKLDQPMRSGDSITLQARQSIAGTYQDIGTTSTTVLSFPYTSMPFQSWEWIQFKVVLNCNPTATSSSFMRLRQIRIR